jgi:hypothetical protein
LTAASGDGGDERVRTADPLRARQVLSQLSYIPIGGLRFSVEHIKQRGWWA